MGHSCWVCNGEGFIRLEQNAMKTCENCLGEGWLEPDPKPSRPTAVPTTVAEIPPVVVVEHIESSVVPRFGRKRAAEKSGSKT